jgi:hypothetical protein
MSSPIPAPIPAPKTPSNQEINPAHIMAEQAPPQMRTSTPAPMPPPKKASKPDNQAEIAENAENEFLPESGAQPGPVEPVKSLKANLGDPADSQ